MPLNVKSISVSFAVICFFGISIVSGLSRISPLTCCKRAVIAAFIVYVVTTLTVKIINAILINAMINTQYDKQREKASDS